MTIKTEEDIIFFPINFIISRVQFLKKTTGSQQSADSLLRGAVLHNYRFFNVVNKLGHFVTHYQSVPII